MGRFFIRDCNGDIVGNPKGYRTMRGAMQQQNQRGSPAWRAIYEAFDRKRKENPNCYSLSEIRLEK